MRILTTGGTGLIGCELVKCWLDQQYQVTLLSRSAHKALALFQSHRFSDRLSAVENLSVFSDLNDFDAVINLAGEPIFDKPWTAQQKDRLWQSRLKMTEKLTALINASQTPPTCFLSGSAYGYYADSGEQRINEQQSAGQGFTAQLCQQWENAAQQANIRVCLLRTGMVFSPKGGALAKILPLYRCGLGGKLGDGNQFMPWIALEDMVNAIDFLLHNSACQGAFNLCSPQPVQNKQFNQLLAKQLRRPAWARVPAFLLRILLGERASLVLESQRLYPEKLLKQGFSFQYAELSNYLRATFGKSPINV
ncbi:TIGR01777 family oxidoreductase [Lonepinella sp. BR2357]|uniref:TIGR01777 family oxidoreductase n=1 Tax=Lonepinella sp. BR2357 TaxID=3434549 RepID=UPI003F6DB931